VYVTRVEAKNIRSIRALDWSIEETHAAGWHVVLGNNGAGKSSFLDGAGASRPSSWLPSPSTSRAYPQS